VLSSSSMKPIELWKKDYASHNDDEIFNVVSKDGSQFELNIIYYILLEYWQCDCW